MDNGFVQAVENAGGEVIDFFYYKNTPFQLAVFEKMRDLFWNFIKKIIELFNG